MTSSISSAADKEILARYYETIRSCRAIRSMGSNQRKTYQSADKILGVRTANDHSSLIILNRRAINCWNLFLRFFGCGCLANVNYHLKDVGDYLKKYEWSQQDTHDNAFLTVCAIANRCARQCTDLHAPYGGDMTLRDRLSKEYHLRNKCLKINPETESCDIGAQLNAILQRHVSSLSHKQSPLTDQEKDIIFAEQNLRGLDCDVKVANRRIVPTTYLLKDPTPINSTKVGFATVSAASTHGLVCDVMQEYNVTGVLFVMRNKSQQEVDRIKRGLDALFPANLTKVENSTTTFRAEGKLNYHLFSA